MWFYLKVSVVKNFEREGYVSPQMVKTDTLAVQWRTGDQETFLPIGQTVDFNLEGKCGLAGSGGRIAGEGPVGSLPAVASRQTSTWDIASVQYLPTGSAEPVRAWDFSAAN